MKKDLLNEFMNGKGSKKLKPLFGNIKPSKSNPIDAIMGSKKNSKVSDLMIDLKNNKPMSLIKPKKSGYVGDLMIKKTKGSVNDFMISPKKSNPLNNMKMNYKGDVSGLMINGKNTMNNIMPYMNNTRKGNILGDKITKKQKRYLKRNKGINRFGDFDNDGVINGLDCDMYNPKKHGFISKTKNLVTGRGFKENEDIKEFKDETPQKDTMEWDRQRIKAESKYDKESIDVVEELTNKGATYEQITNYGFSKDKNKYLQENPQFAKIYNSESVQKQIEERDAAEKKLKEASMTSEQKDKELEQAKEMFGEEEKLKKQQKFEAQEAKRRAAQDKEIYTEREAMRDQSAEQQRMQAEQKREKELDRQIKSENLKKRIKDFAKEKAIEKGFYTYDVKQTFEGKKPIIKTEKKFSLAGPLAAATGYAFEQKEARQAFEKEQEQKQLDSAKKIIGANRYKQLQSKGLKGDLNKFILDEARTKLKAREKALSEQKRLDPVKREQLKMELLDARRKIETSKYNIQQMQQARQQAQSKQLQQDLFGPTKSFKGVSGFISGEAPPQRYLRDNRYNDYSADQYTRNISKGSSLPQWPSQRVSNEWVGSDNVRTPNERILPKNRLNGDVEGSMRRLMQRPKITDYDKVEQDYNTMMALKNQGMYGKGPQLIPQENRPYDPEAPRFIYRKNINSFTRKSSRLKPGDEPEIGDVSKPSTSKRASSLYPWTKPMQGWDRVYVGKGRYVGKGAPKRGKSYKTLPSYKKTKPVKKQSFTPYVRTYAMKQLDKDMKKEE